MSKYILLADLGIHEVEISLQKPISDAVSKDTGIITNNILSSLAATKIFYCYAHEDKPWRNELEKHLSAFKRLGQITSWYDRDIQAGTEWKREIDTHLKTADIILLLVSPDFMHSDYCYGVEMRQALERHQAGKARVIPIILRPVVWEETPIGKLQALPTDGIPITRWSDRDEAFRDVARGIGEVITTLLSEKNKAQ